MKKIFKIYDRLLSNLSCLLHRSYKSDYSQIICRLNEIEKTKKNLTQIITNQHFILSVISYYVQHPDEGKPYKEELDYIYKHKNYVNFPYSYSASSENIYGIIDSKTNLPYVLHHGKKLFFPQSYDLLRAKEEYAYLENIERITGKNDTIKSPHQYQSSKYHIDEGDILFDIGCAEGLFSLDNIEKVSHVYLIESDIKWITCLKKTFEPYSEKVTIINKKIGQCDNDDTITLSTLLLKTSPSPLYLKMDIEGAEISVMKHSRAFLSSYPSRLKLGIAAYHKQDDCKQLINIVSGLSFNYELSSGYMLFNLYDIPEAPFFRKGIVRASNVI